MLFIIQVDENLSDFSHLNQLKSRKNKPQKFSLNLFFFGLMKLVGTNNKKEIELDCIENKFNFARICVMNKINNDYYCSFLNRF